MDIEIVNTEDKPITGIRMRSVLADIQTTNTDYRKLVAILMKYDREAFYKNKQMLIDVLESSIKKSFIEGHRSGIVHTQFIGVENEKKASEVYPENGFTLKD